MNENNCQQYQQSPYLSSMKILMETPTYQLYILYICILSHFSKIVNYTLFLYIYSLHILSIYTLFPSNMKDKGQMSSPNFVFLFICVVSPFLITFFILSTFLSILLHSSLLIITNKLPTSPERR